MYDKQTPPSKVLSHCVGVRVCAHIHPHCGLVSILLCTHIVSLCSFSLCFIPVHVCHTSISSAWEISPGNQGMRLLPTVCSAQVLRTKVSLQIHVTPIFHTILFSSSCICGVNINNKFVTQHVFAVVVMLVEMLWNLSWWPGCQHSWCCWWPWCWSWYWGSWLCLCWWWCCWSIYNDDDDNDYDGAEAKLHLNTVDMLLLCGLVGSWDGVGVDGRVGVG